MKMKTTLLLMLGVATSSVIAQSAVPQMQSGSQTQTPSSAPAQPAPSTPQAQPRSQSSGAVGQSQSGTSSSSPTDEASSAPSSDIMQNLPPPAPMTQLEPKTENGFTYLCGGVGADEAKQLKQSARDYDMMLTFATRKGNFLADVNVDIQDPQGKTALKTSCDGPLMLVDFPRSGTYKIRAETGGYTLNKTARVQAKGRRHATLVMTWPQQVATAVEAATSSSGSSGGNNGTNDNNGTR